MQKQIRNFLVLGLIMACVPVVIAAPKEKKTIAQGRITKKQQKLNDQLFDAVDYCNVKKVKQLIADGADANAKTIRGLPLLTYAAWCDRVEVVEILILAGADVNARDSEGSTALMIPSPMGIHMIDPISMLISWFKPNKFFGHQNHAQIISLLVKAGADVNLKNNKGETALMYARVYMSLGYRANKFEQYVTGAEGHKILIAAGAHSDEKVVKNQFDLSMPYF